MTKRSAFEVSALVLIPVLALVAPVLERLAALGVPFRSEGGILFIGGASALGLAMGLAAGATRLLPGIIGRALPAFCLAAAMIIAIDIGFGGLSIFETLTGTAIVDVTANDWGPLDFSMLAVLALAGGLTLVWSAVPRMLGIFTVVVLLVTIVKHLPHDRLEAPAVAASDQPSTIFVVLDEMIGLAGLRAVDVPEADEAAAALVAMLDRHGFKVYPNAYSRHFFSDISIPAMLNYDPNYLGPTPIGSSRTYRLFDDAASAKTPVTVYQTQHIDFCTSPAVTRCESFPSFDPFNTYSEDTLPTQVLTAALLRNVEDSILAMVLRSFYEVAAGPTPLPERFELHGFGRWMDHIRESVIDAGRGHAHFLHVLAPHAPYFLRNDCSIGLEWTFGYYLAETQSRSGDDLETTRLASYREYAAQVSCVAIVLDRFLDGILGNPGLADATIVLTGDHGSRISRGKFLENLAERDFVDNHSTFFAVRTPGETKGTNATFASVQSLAGYYLGEVPIDQTDEHSVAIQRLSEEWVRAPMPVLSTLPD